MNFYVKDLKSFMDFVFKTKKILLKNIIQQN